MAPFFIVPFLGFVVGAQTGVLTGDPRWLTGLGVGLALWGAWTARSLMVAPDRLALDANHPSWRHMYLMVVTAQVGVLVAYLAGR